MQNHKLAALYEAPIPMKKLLAMSAATCAGIFVVMLVLLPTSPEIAGMGGLIFLGIVFYSLYLFDIILQKKYCIISGICQSIETGSLMSVIQKRWDVYIQDETGKYYKFILYGKSKKHIMTGDRVTLFVKKQGAIIENEECDTILSYMALERRHQNS